MTEKTEIVVDGVSYYRRQEDGSFLVGGATFSPKKEEEPGNRSVFIINGGWIIAGDHIEDDDFIYLTDNKIIRRFEEFGIEGAIANPTDSRVTIKTFEGLIKIPRRQETFRVSVPDDWGHGATKENRKLGS